MWARFYIPIIALFYIASQVSIEQFSIIMAVFALVTLLLEIPSGVIADLLGKKNTLIIATILYLIELVIVSFANGFWPFLIAKIISGIGVSLASGTGAALLYDSLKKVGRTNEHKKISGTQFMIRYISMGIVFIIGAYLFTISTKLPALISIPFVSIGLILLFFIKEPFKPLNNFNFKNSISHFKEGFYFFKCNNSLKTFAFLSLIVGASITITQASSSIYFEKILIPVYAIGIIAFIASAITAFVSKKSYSIEKAFGEKYSIYFIQGSSFLTLILFSFMSPYIGVIFYFFISAIQGFYEVTINHYVNEKINSEHRATMLSINNFFVHAGIFVLFPLFGFITQRSEMNYAFLSLAAIFLIYNVILYLFSNILKFKHKR